MLTRVVSELIQWVREMSRLTRFGLIVLVLGASIDFFYHGVILTILPLPGTQETIVEYAGHLITFFGMVLMLLGVVTQAHQRSRSHTRPAEPLRSVVSHWVSLRRR